MDESRCNYLSFIRRMRGSVFSPAGPPGAIYFRLILPAAGKFSRAGRIDCSGPGEDGRSTAPPIEMPLPGSAELQHLIVREPWPDDLQADGQSGRRPAAGDRGRRLAGQIEGVGERRPSRPGHRPVHLHVRRPIGLGRERLDRDHRHDQRSKFSNVSATERLKAARACRVRK